jgi:hypothetical protein
MFVEIKPSNRKNKRLLAIFYDKDKKKVKMTHFGLKGASTFIDHNDNKKKDAYEARHKVNEDWDNYTSAGSLAFYILWNQPTLDRSIRDYANRFNLKVI